VIEQQHLVRGANLLDIRWSPVERSEADLLLEWSDHILATGEQPASLAPVHGEIAKLSATLPGIPA
jgi:hypothetical protein